MSNAAPKTYHDSPMLEASQKKTNPWNIRDNLGSVDAMKRYDVYITEHKRRLRQLEKEARGDMCPSDEWYRE